MFEVSKTQATLVCPICLYDCFIPVEITCFPCSNGKIFGCCSLQRFCLSCCITLLQLNVAIDMRSPDIKCLFCPCKVSAYQLKLSDSFRIDYLEISRHDDNDDRACPFCHEIMSYIHLPRHIMEVCPFYMEDCLCGGICMRRNKRFHQASCRAFMSCRFCFENIPRKYMEDHLTNDHRLIKCDGCDKFIQRERLLVHINRECPSRVIACRFCDLYVTGDKILRHLDRHIDEKRSRLEDMKAETSQLEKEVDDIVAEWRMFYEFHNPSSNDGWLISLSSTR